MKTKTVEFYVDLWPDWHELPASQNFLSASTKPYDTKQPDNLRVKITVDLPEHTRTFAVDDAVHGTATVVTQ